MGSNPKDITDINDLRSFVRELYIEGFQGRGKHDVVKAESTANDLKTRIHFFFDEEFISKNLEKEDVLKFDSRYVPENPLFPICKMCHFTPSEITMDFAILDLLNKNPEGISIYDLRTTGKDLLGKYFPEKEQSVTGIDHRQIEPVIANLEAQGIIYREEDGKRNLYKLTDTAALKQLLRKPSVLDAIRFASEVFPCGVIGSYILDTIDCAEHKSFVHFKHHFLFNALDSEVIFKLLKAISDETFVSLEFEKATIKIIPVQIRHSLRDGRTHLIYYNTHPDYEGFASANIENIKNVFTSEKCDFINDIKAKFQSYSKYLGGKSGQNSNGKTERFEFTIRFSDDEQYVPIRLKREAYCGNVEINENTAQFSTELYDTGELRPWLRSFLGRIEDFHFTNSQFQNQMKKEFQQMANLYNGNDVADESNYITESTGPAKTASKKEKYKQSSQEPSIFFNRIYSQYYHAARKIINAIQNHEIKTKEELNNFFDNFSFLVGKTESKTDAKKFHFRNEILGGLKKDSSPIRTPIETRIDFPLSKLEISFLKAMVADPRCRLFFEPETLKVLETELSQEKFSSIKPYFTYENFLLFDKYTNGDTEKYTESKYIEIFKFLFSAVQENERIKVTYIEDGIEKTKIAEPQKFEYSEKEDRFKVILPCKTRPLDIQNILSVSYTNEPLSSVKEKEYLTCKVAIIDNTSNHYHRNRVFREFSHFERNCKKIDDTGHILSFDFEKGDIKEVAVRLLQFGPHIYVSEPNELVEIIRGKVVK